MNTKIKFLCSVILCSVILTGCSGNRYLEESNTKVMNVQTAVDTNADCVNYLKTAVYDGIFKETPLNRDYFQYTQDWLNAQGYLVVYKNKLYSQYTDFLTLQIKVDPEESLESLTSELSFEDFISSRVKIYTTVDFDNASEYIDVFIDFDDSRGHLVFMLSDGKVLRINEEVTDI